jgi:hypothetical protein
MLTDPILLPIQPPNSPSPVTDLLNQGISNRDSTPSPHTYQHYNPTAQPRPRLRLPPTYILAQITQLSGPPLAQHSHPKQTILIPPRDRRLSEAARHWRSTRAQLDRRRGGRRRYAGVQVACWMQGGGRDSRAASYSACTLEVGM